MMTRRVGGLLAAFLVLAAGDLAAQTKFGGQVSWGDESDFGIGGRLAVDAADIPLEIFGTFDWFFPDEPPGVDLTYWEINGNLAYLFEIRDAPSIIPYAGGGLNIAHVNRETSTTDVSDTEVGLNLLGGIRFETQASVQPFIEFRLEVEGGDQFVVSAGVLFF